MATTVSAPSYPDDVSGALPQLTAPPGSRYYDTFVSNYPSTDWLGIVMTTHQQCSALCHRSEKECETELIDAHLRSQRLQSEISERKSNSQEQPSMAVFYNGGHEHASGSSTSRQCVSRCGAWDSLGSGHAWQTGSISLATKLSSLHENLKTGHFVIATEWEQKSVSPDDRSVLAAMLPTERKANFDSSALIYRATKTMVSCASPQSASSLVTVTDKAYLYDVLTMPPRPDGNSPSEAQSLFDLALGLDARSAFVILLASDHTKITAALLHQRSCFYNGAHVGECISDIPDELFSFSTPNSLYVPKQSNALSPKLSGVARDLSLVFDKAVEHVGARGCMSLPTPFSFTIGYDVGMYGPDVGSVFANLDTSFLYDYSVGNQIPEVKAMLQECFQDICSKFNGGTLVEGYISTVIPIIWANYEALNYKTRMEDSIVGDSQPCAVVWKNLSLLAAYRAVDGAFMHAWYDSDMSAEATAMAGLGLAVHDLFDLSADLSCGEVANVVPSLTNGDLSLSSLAALYSRLGAVLRWYGSNMPDEPAALAILLTFWWQLGNMRHRIVQAVHVVEESERTQIPLITTIDHRPVFEDFAVGDLHDQKPLWQSPQDLIAIPDLENSELPPEFVAVGIDFVLRYGASARDPTAQPPPDHMCAAKIMAALSIGMTSTTRVAMWEWTSYLWDSGACWYSFLGTLCYRHKGRLNDDRARTTYTSDVWLNEQREQDLS